MTFEKLNEFYVLIARTSTKDRNGKEINSEVSKLAIGHVYLSWEDARKARQRFVTNVLTSCNTATPIRAIGRDGFPTEEYKGYVISYEDGGRYESELSLERVTIEA